MDTFADAVQRHEGARGLLLSAPPTHTVLLALFGSEKPETPVAAAAAAAAAAATAHANASDASAAVQTPATPATFKPRGSEWRRPARPRDTVADTEGGVDTSGVLSPGSWATRARANSRSSHAANHRCALCGHPSHAAARCPTVKCSVCRVYGHDCTALHPARVGPVSTVPTHGN